MLRLASLLAAVTILLVSMGPDEAGGAPHPEKHKHPDKHPGKHKDKEKHGGKHAGQPPAGGPHPHAAQVAELHAIQQLLERADHDYRGHRAAAVRGLGSAIRELDPGHPGAAGRVPGGHEPQKLSDAQLRQALRQLEALHGHFGKGAGNHPGAAGHIEKAIADLKKALEVR